MRLARVVFMRAAGMAAAFALVLGTSSSAQADEASGDWGSERARAETAEASHRAAVAAYARGHYHDAIELFLAANRLRPSAALSFNVARCYEQLDDAPSALAWYRDYLRRSGNPSDGARVARQIAKFEKRLAQKGLQQVSVLSTPRGASVRIDGTPVGVSPWTGALAPGVHSVDLTLAGYESASEQFELTPDHARDVELRLVTTAVKQESRAGPMPVAAPVQPARPRYFVAAAEHPAATQVLDAGERKSVLSTAGWIAVGASGAALTGALVFEALRQGAEKDAQRETVQIRFAQDLETMHSRQTAARVLVGTAAGLAVAGGVLLLVGAGNVEHASGPQVALSCTSSNCNASVAGRF